METLGDQICEETSHAGQRDRVALASSTIRSAVAVTIASAGNTNPVDAKLDASTPVGSVFLHSGQSRPSSVTHTPHQSRSGTLLAISPALERVVGPKLGHGGIRDLLMRWSTTTAIRATGRGRVRNRIAKRSPRTAEAVTDAIWEVFDAQSVTLPAESA